VPELLDEVERLCGLLRTYGDHRWECAVSKAFRDQTTAPCDCGWQEIREKLS
jgi:hypothetical protein